MTTDRNTADFVRAQLEQIDKRPPGAATEDAEAYSLLDWRTACHDMARMSRAALKAIEDGRG